MSDILQSKIFRCQVIGPKRQMTIPTSMMDQLRLIPGDFLIFEVSGQSILKTTPAKLTPVDNLTDEQVKQIELSAQQVREDKIERYPDVQSLREQVRGSRSREDECQETELVDRLSEV